MESDSAFSTGILAWIEIRVKFLVHIFNCIHFVPGIKIKDLEWALNRAKQRLRELRRRPKKQSETEEQRCGHSANALWMQVLLFGYR